jgi:hypothetical protein
MTRGTSISPIFHLLDQFKGTLILDEADFRFSDATADIAKILNNGNVKGFPVLRSESKDGKEFSPRAFQVFGPKLVGMRGHFDDPALESRFLTENAGGKLRPDISVNLPEEQRFEALRLRNKLLMFRFQNYFRLDDPAPFLKGELEPRLNQILSPLSAVMDPLADAVTGFISGPRRAAPPSTEVFKVPLSPPTRIGTPGKCSSTCRVGKNVLVAKIHPEKSSVPAV